MFYNWLRWDNAFETGHTLAWMGSFISPGDRHNTLALLVSPWKGLLFFAPVIVLWPWALCRQLGTSLGQRLAVASIIVFVSYILFEEIIGYRCGGGFWCWGPRTMTNVLPCIILVLGTLFRSSSRISKAAITFVCTASVLVQVSGIMASYKTHLYRTILEEPSIAPALTEYYIEDKIYESALWSWGNSPILGQIKSLGHIIQSPGSSSAYYKEVISSATKPRKLDQIVIRERFETWPTSTNFDFWWVYVYFLYELDSIRLLTIVITILLAIFTGIGLKGLFFPRASRISFTS